MDVGAVAADLQAEAAFADERRLLVLHGERGACYDAAEAALEATLGFEGTALIGLRECLPCERVRPKHADRLLGTTQDAVVVDCHDRTDPNALGRVVGAVDGGGLLLLLAPPLDRWPDAADGFDEGLAVPPFDTGDVTGRFRRRLASLLRIHPGVCIVDVDAGAVERDGRTDPAPRLPREPPTPPAEHAFPAAAYEACLTADQADAVAAFEHLRDPGTALVLEADRGRGKSAAAGIAAACLAVEGLDVLVVAPERRNAAEVFERAESLLSALGALNGTEGTPPTRLDAAGGGAVRYASPPDADPESADAVFVDEAAALPVRVLERFLAAPRVAFVTTVHGYEGSGRGFDVRFRDRLAAADRDLREATLVEPIRYAGTDPVEAWAFRALMLDARPAADPLVADADPGAVAYGALPPERLLADENLLGEAFGLLVAAHYRTEPDDLARLLDAPNVRCRALTHGGHVAAVCLLAREGGLDADLRAAMYEGARVRGNMLPDVLTSQLRDEAAGRPVGWRVLRIATHGAVRSRGLGSRLLDAVEDDPAFADADWLGAGFGATPDLLSFWGANGFSTVHLATTRNERSGEHSAVVLRPLSAAGAALRDRHAAWFARRVGGVLADPLDGLDPDVVRGALRACDAAPPLDLSDREWRVVAGAAHGPGLYTVDPAPFRAVARYALLTGAGTESLDVRAERLLVRKVLQARPWDAVADELGFHSTGQCMRALGDAFVPLVEELGGAAARAEAARYADE
jgi:tRNA(Met) cytidine acetyltransferase